MFSENFPKDQQPLERAMGYSSITLGHSRPSWIKSEHLTPPFRYPWAETYPTLLALKESEGDPFDGIHLGYTHPINGGQPFLPFPARCSF